MHAIGRNVTVTVAPGAYGPAAMSGMLLRYLGSGVRRPMPAPVCGGVPAGSPPPVPPPFR